MMYNKHAGIDWLSLRNKFRDRIDKWQSNNIEDKINDDNLKKSIKLYYDKYLIKNINDVLPIENMPIEIAVNYIYNSLDKLRRKEIIQDTAETNAINFIEFLDKNELLKPPIQEFFKKYEKIHERNINIELIINNITPLSLMNNIVTPGKIQTDDNTNIHKPTSNPYLMSYISITTPLYDHFFNILPQWLDLDKFDFNKEAVTKSQFDHNHIQELKKKKLNHNIIKILDDTIQNRFIHYDWYIENNMLYGNNSKVKYKIGDFVEKTMLFTFFYYKTNKLIINRLTKIHII